MSFDVATSPEIRLHGWGRGTASESAASGWGFGWYPEGESGSVVIKDPIPTGSTPLSKVLRDWERFRGPLFVCHIRGAAHRASQEDTHPFIRSYAGRDFLLAHNGRLDIDRLRELPMGEPALFEPNGRTDSELVLCQLLYRLREHGARRFADVPFRTLFEWLAAFDRFGTLNLVITDGTDLVAYRDEEGFNGLHLLCRRPPHKKTRLKSSVLTLSFPDPEDQNRSMAFVATTPVSQDRWEPMAPGQMLVLRRGAVIWSSSADHPGAGADAGADESWQRTFSELPPPLMRAAVIGRVHSEREPSRHPEPKRGAAARTMRVFHESVYRYQDSVEQSSHVFRLQPLFDRTQTLLEHSLVVEPRGDQYAFDDVFGNHTLHARLREPYRELRVVAQSLVRVVREPPVPHLTRRTSIPLVWMPWQRQMMLPYLLPPELPESQLRELSEYAMGFVERQDYDLYDTLSDINRTIRSDYAYVSQSTTLETTPWDVYVQRKGVCQDFANLFICLARLLGVPARYRVGYIFTGANYENQLQSDASHAWVECYLPWAGWRGYDPTNGVRANVDHVRVAAGRHYRDATPTSGTLYKGGRGEQLDITVRVTALDE